MKKRYAPPKAAAMVESLRGLGYSTSSALADIIDNSISACADRIELTFVWSGRSSRIEIRDNGRGMSPNELDRAMRLGDVNPLSSREKDDLGRFGMGLKTASFSQCRSLTVASWQSEAASCLRWDLDVLASEIDEGWYLLEGPAKDSEAYIVPMEYQQQGTLVLWEKLDRIITDGFNEQDFLDLIDQIERHLAMVFHRFLAGDAFPISILINGRNIKEWDPFLTGHLGKAWTSTELQFSTTSGPIVAACHVLPHKDRLNEKEYNDLGGTEGWIASQGFYVYRNKRLLVAGDWLGLSKGRRLAKDESYQLARIRLDIPNTADEQWNIDIKKSSARPPVEVKLWLTRLAEETRTRAKKAVDARSKATRVYSQKEAEATIWVAEHIGHITRYRINRDHPQVAVLLEGTEDENELYDFFELLESHVPVQQLFTATEDALTQVEEDRPPEDSPSEAIQSLLLQMFENYVACKGYSKEATIRLLQSQEPFSKYPVFVAEALKN